VSKPGSDPARLTLLGDANIHRALGRRTVGRAIGRVCILGPSIVAIDSRILLSFWPIRRRGSGTRYGGKFISIQSWLVG